ncbi:rod shape-determining protein [Candidatus Roizmanbacteria bacterium RIFCSPHIGHO2_02_FULL_37_15]|uniref:Cell shape-determining protein MreB n=1 Tax=Candidatus Roizmanbacteria bacterium RIFCSPLOWO2_01_FULL_37_16 TaxID=1802058 RepID=A0A1F7ILA5_9BACT|nr:MAG: rod shape-determining protein [Candidatus Roizmanbacteria bacterium RIFCSPHIGHO2_01_FULL_37_16b]OGK22358.1 MAG: rod shape-determining protein [Candidatus Roizmanbacteria bacterium RIFCSPHIGHO2_02_FULL_37_15]OGK33199.1 MAG: rod shape-determining protein [Candidatus Roizmanbacteria bacterium RIFCSPHIGHO2_12_FULL_36_11]OGK44176.1 MAG: rod shape-determining protein [Candidatus Roizmanbacteria bacterium RIFCSPLOWO2_01_FULL_37_16]OGK57719.1 MAG: rod shape-determining protein [Candidatus Roizm
MFFSKKVGVDLGTANTLVYVAGEGIVLNEPTVVAYSLEDKKILAVGNDAREMLGRTPGSIVASRPMREGVIADYRTTSAMITFFLKKALKGRVLWPQVMIAIPVGASQVEKRAVVAACKQAGASDVYLIDEPLAAAIGAKIPISHASGHMIVNLGGGTSEMAIISLGQLVVYSTVRVAGNKLDEAIMQVLRREHNLIIGERTAEEIKFKIGNAFIVEEISNRTEAVKERIGETASIKKTSNERTMEVKGRDFQSGMPKILEIGEHTITSAFHKPLKQILEGIKQVFAKTPPELAADIVDKGIVLSGGTASLTNIDKYLTYYTGVSSFVVEDPLFCVIRGVGMAIENLDNYKEAIR